MRHHGRTFGPEPFILDTGAVRSVAPLSWAKNLLDLSPAPPFQDSGMTDVQGHALRGIPRHLKLELLFPYPDMPLSIQETVWFCPGVRHGLLGQTAFFEQLGAIFLNFPQALAGRRFGLFPPPSPLLRPE
jgi:hypothetical protein